MLMTVILCAVMLNADVPRFNVVSVVMLSVVMFQYCYIEGLYATFNQGVCPQTSH